MSGCTGHMVDLIYYMCNYIRWKDDLISSLVYDCLKQSWPHVLPTAIDSIISH